MPLRLELNRDQQPDRSGRAAVTRRTALLALPAAAAGIALARSRFGWWPGDPAADLFRPDIFHDAGLEMEPRDWKALRDNVFANDYYPATLTIDGESQGKVAVRSRGDGSRFHDKPSFKVDVNHYVKGQKFHGLKTIVLKNLGEDETGLRERLAFAVFEAVGIKAPRQAHTRMRVNGEERGVYSLVEPVRKPFLRARFGGDAGNLFDYQYETNPEVLYDFSDRGPDAKSYVPRPFKPRTHKRSPQTAPLVRFLRALNQAPDATVGQVLEEHLDVRQFVTYIAVENALADMDGFGAGSGRNNFLLYQASARDRFMFIPWDKDMTLQRADLPVFLNSDRNVLTRRLLKDPVWRRTYQDTVARVVESFVNEGWMMPRLEAGLRQIREAFLADRHMPFPRHQYDLRVNDLRRTIERRPYGILPGATWS